MSDTVSVQVALPRVIAAVRVRLPMARVPAVFGEHLNKVYDAARNGAVRLDGQNIFVYRNTGAPGEVDVEFGVGALAPFTAVGPVVCSSLPTGEVATTTHRGDYSRLGDAHSAVIAWCKANGRTPNGTRWEIYGHWTDDTSQLRTDVCYLLEPAS